MDILEEINALKEKQEKAKAALAKAKAQKEALEERKDELVTRLKEDFNTTLTKAPTKLKEMEAEVTTLLEKAKKKLDSIEL